MKLWEEGMPHPGLRDFRELPSLRVVKPPGVSHFLLIRLKASRTTAQSALPSHFGEGGDSPVASACRAPFHLVVPGARRGGGLLSAAFQKLGGSLTRGPEATAKLHIFAVATNLASSWDIAR